MRKVALLSTGCLCVFLLSAQSIQLRDVVNGYYNPKTVSDIRPSSDGEHYTRMSDDRTMVLQYSFKDGTVSDTLFNTANARGCDFKTFDDYQFSPDESRMLIQTDTRRIYRRSFSANHHLFSIKNNKLEKLSSGGPQQVPLFSPDGNMIAFVRNNDIYLIKLLFNNSESQITTDGEAGKRLNGLPDWVYEEEFTVTRAFDFSADSKMIAYIKYDESEVPLCTLPIYSSKEMPFGEYTPFNGSYNYKYPVAGTPNSKVSVHTFDIKSRVTRQAALPLQPGDYIPYLQFTCDPNCLATVLLNRHQSRMDLYDANPKSGISRLLLREESEEYLKESAYRGLTFYPGHFIMQSERSGQNHLYLYSMNGEMKEAITEGESGITELLGWDQRNNIFYYAAHSDGPLRTAVYKKGQNGKITCLTPRKGSNRSVISRTFAYLLNTYSNLSSPPESSIIDCKNGKERNIVPNNLLLKERLSKINMPQKELFTFTTGNGTELNGWMIKPVNMNPNKKYPVILYQYGAPGSQSVKDAWEIGFYPGALWEAYLTEQGFIVACVDGRGTAGRGTAFEKANYMHLGTMEAEDQAEAARYLSTLPYIDKSNIGIWGWSYGGYNTLMSMSRNAHPFKAGVAVAPVTDWRFYDSVYAERFMRTPKENGEGYRDASAIDNASKMEGKLLLIHGTADDNVHFTNTLKYISALIQNGKDYRLQIYPDCNHSIYYGENTRYHLFRQITDFFTENLKQ